MLHPWKTLQSKRLIDDEWMQLRADTCQREDGLVIEPYYVMESRDFVHAIPVLADGRIVLVRQYRHAAKIFGLEFPGGVLDEGEEPLVGARRELEEECGATGGQWSEAASFYTNPARQTNRFHCFLGIGVELNAATNFDANEELELHLLTLEEIDQAIAEGSFHQAPHIAAFLMARERLVAL
ncbi:NUDIX hydrolase [Opitutaceae bacterium]|nr:NUDIX hydrolase [Opitutaceae bacterium]